MTIVEMQDDGQFRAECRKCDWFEDYADTKGATDAACFHKYGFARGGGLFGQVNRPELLCPTKQEAA